jgi:hypothetical protein
LKSGHSHRKRHLQLSGFNHIDLLAFQKSLAALSANDIDDYVEQLTADLRAAVDRYAPMRTHQRRIPKADNRLLSKEVMAAKRQAYL